MQKLKKHPVLTETLVLFLLVIGIFFWFNFHKAINLPPQSLHAWRQTDCTSQTLNYYQHGMHFFKPELHVLISDNKTTGYSVEEFPIVFYTVAALYKVFGYHHWVYRLFTFLFFIIGLWSVYRLCRNFVNNKWLAVALPLLFFSSTVLAFYSINFIGNIPAIGITLLGWLFFIQFYQTEKRKFWFIALALFTFSTLLKISEGISIGAIGLLYLIEILGYKSWRINKHKLFKRIDIVYFVAAIAIVIAWYFWAHQYNAAHNQQYYTFHWNPIWSLSHGWINEVWNTVLNRWLYNYFHTIFLVLLFLGLLSIIIFFKKFNRLLASLSLFLTLGSIFYLLSFFSNLHDHDYYMISVYIVPVFVFITLLEFVSRNYSNKVNWLILSLLLICLLIALPKTRRNLNGRYFVWEYEFPQTSVYQSFYNIEPYLDSIGVDKNDKIISIPDFSTCYTLYLSNRKGWTCYMGENSDSSRIAQNIEKGAKYLLLNDIKLADSSYLKPFINQEVGIHGSVHIYKLK
jgi:hypothetical protein